MNCINTMTSTLTNDLLTGLHIGKMYCVLVITEHNPELFGGGTKKAEFSIYLNLVS